MMNVSGLSQAAASYAEAMQAMPSVMRAAVSEAMDLRIGFKFLGQIREKGWRYSIGESARGDLHRVVVWREQGTSRNVKYRIVHDQRYESLAASLTDAIHDAVAWADAEDAKPEDHASEGRPRP